jgi:hypothetical protein
MLARATTNKWKCVTEQEKVAPNRRGEYREVGMQLINNTFREVKVREQSLTLKRS